MMEPLPPTGRSHGTENDTVCTEYFDLKESPFSLTPDPQYLFEQAAPGGASHLLYGVQQSGGFVQLTVGSGKTTLCRCLIRQLPHTDRPDPESAPDGDGAARRGVRRTPGPYPEDLTSRFWSTP